MFVKIISKIVGMETNNTRASDWLRAKTFLQLTDLIFEHMNKGPGGTEGSDVKKTVRFTLHVTRI